MNVKITGEILSIEGGRPPDTELPTSHSEKATNEVPVMTTAIIGTGGIGSVIARRLASGETLRLSSADHESARTLAEEIGRAAVVAVYNRDA
ncbi:hypothetical protein [Pseudonocardia sp.]|uniref:hypothetical protein n=1 Tax=Pseudonocardia sp. TaxID=60912 RepID=UPI00262A1FC0|nr:hypothetical protein [Pseudonocardia sp.]MCW2718873.1 hypothetical protein [Pseudonocardia sp.]MDT7613907.1 hypothetical protein [Pseudonocardiales bacterium]